MADKKYMNEERAQELIDEVKARLDKKLDKGKGVYQAGGSKAFADLPAASATTLGMVYNITDDFTTTEDFVEGDGIDVAAGTDVAVVLVKAASDTDPAEYGYNIFGGSGVIHDITQTELAEMWKDDGVITLSATTAALTSVGDTADITVTATGTVTVESDDTDIATVSITDDTITVTAVAAGTATVTVTSASSAENKKATAEITVTVTV